MTIMAATHMKTPDWSGNACNTKLSTTMIIYMYIQQDKTCGCHELAILRAPPQWQPGSSPSFCRLRPCEVRFSRENGIIITLNLPSLSLRVSHVAAAAAITEIKYCLQGGKMTPCGIISFDSIKVVFYLVLILFWRYCVRGFHGVVTRVTPRGFDSAK